MSGQIWILYRRPKEVAKPKDWPAPYVARRFALEGGVPAPTNDLRGADTFGELVALLPKGLEIHARTPEDPDDIIETRGAMPPPPVVQVDGRLSSGMTVVEALARAAAWWERTGRHVVNKEFNQEKGKDKVKFGGQSAGFRLPGEVTDVIPSGILKGLPWDMLTKLEKKDIVRSWHQEYVIKPLFGQAPKIAS